MHRNVSSSPDSVTQKVWIHRVLGDQHFEPRQGFFSWWYRHTSPPDAAPDATFQQRDRVRRGRLASALMLFLATVLFLAGAVGASSPNHTILIVVSSMAVAMVLSIPVNRRGGVEVVGVLMVLGLTVGMYTSVMAGAFSGGMSANDKDILYLLFFSELFAGALLPINVVFLIALINIIFSFVALRFLPHDPAFALQLKTSFAAIFPRLIQIHIIASGVMWILVNNLKSAIRRADLAEEVARLQHDLHLMTSAQLQQKHTLEQCIDEIVGVQMLVANGDLNARVSYTSANSLWKVAGPLNTLLGRFQRAKQAEEEMLRFSQHMAEAQSHVRQEVAAAIKEQRPLLLPVTDALLAPLYQELNGKCLTQPQPQRLLQH